jgi:hypothetical protein
MILPMNLVEDVPQEAREANIFTTVGEVPKAAAISVPRTLSDGSRSEMLLGLCCSQRLIASIYVLSIRGVSQSRGLTRDRKGTPNFNIPSQNWTLQMLPL